MSLPSSPRRDPRHVRQGQRSDLCIVAMVAIFPADQHRHFGRRSTGATVSRPDWHRHNICNLRGCGHREPLACVPILACNVNSSAHARLWRRYQTEAPILHHRTGQENNLDPCCRERTCPQFPINGRNRVTGIVKCSRSRPRHRSSLKCSGHKFHLKSHHAVV
jgi:hypothetical protein